MPRAPLPLLALLLGAVPAALGAGCGGRPDPPPAPRAAEPPPLAEGLRLTLAPNLPGVAAEDVPLTARRHVEIVHFDGARLRLRWTGRVLIERPESARRRED